MGEEDEEERVKEIIGLGWIEKDPLYEMMVWFCTKRVTNTIPSSHYERKLGT